MPGIKKLSEMSISEIVQNATQKSIIINEDSINEVCIKLLVVKNKIRDLENENERLKKVLNSQ